MYTAWAPACEEASKYSAKGAVCALGELEDAPLGARKSRRDAENQRPHRPAVGTVARHGGPAVPVSLPQAFWLSPALLASKVSIKYKS